MASAAARIESNQQQRRDGGVESPHVSLPQTISNMYHGDLEL